MQGPALLKSMAGPQYTDALFHLPRVSPESPPHSSHGIPDSLASFPWPRSRISVLQGPCQVPPPPRSLP